MSIVIEEIVEKAREIPIILDGKNKKLGDLEERKIYETVMRSSATGDRIYLGEKTRQGIAIHLFHMGVIDGLTLCNFGYKILAKSPEEEN